MTLSSRDVPALVRLQQRALIVGVVALLAGFVGAAMNVDQFFRSWLIGFLFCLSLSLGSLALLMLQHLSGGQWGMVGRRIFEAGSRLLPIVLALAVPVIIGMPKIFWRVRAGDFSQMSLRRMGNTMAAMLKKIQPKNQIVMV